MCLLGSSSLVAATPTLTPTRSMFCCSRKMFLHVRVKSVPRAGIAFALSFASGSRFRLMPSLLQSVVLFHSFIVPFFSSLSLGVQKYVGVPCILKF